MSDVTTLETASQGGVQTTEATVTPVAAQNASTGQGQAATTTPATTSAAVQPYYSDWLQSDGKLNPKALDRLPEHLAHLKPTLERQGTLDDVLNVFANQQILAGKKGLAPLPENAPENVRNERKALMDTLNGVPKDVAGYGILKPKDVPDQYWNPKLTENFAKWAQKHSVSPAAAREMVEVNAGFLKEQLKEQETYTANFFKAQQDTITAALKLDNVPADKAKALAEQGFKRLGVDLSKPEGAGLMQNANAFLMAYRHAVATGEDKFVDGNSAATQNGSAIEQANDIIHNKANPDHEAYWNKSGSDPRARAVREKVEQLFRAGVKK
jgi:hypothetical protein